MSCAGPDLAPDSGIPPGLRILNGDNHQPQCVPPDHATIQSAVFTTNLKSFKNYDGGTYPLIFGWNWLDDLDDLIRIMSGFWNLKNLIAWVTVGTFWFQIVALFDGFLHQMSLFVVFTVFTSLMSLFLVISFQTPLKNPTRRVGGTKPEALGVINLLKTGQGGACGGHVKSSDEPDHSPQSKIISKLLPRHQAGRGVS